MNRWEVNSFKESQLKLKRGLNLSSKSLKRRSENLDNLLGSKLEQNKENLDLKMSRASTEKALKLNSYHKIPLQGSSGSCSYIAKELAKSEALDKDIENILFRNRNLIEIIRIRDTEICKNIFSIQRTKIEEIRADELEISQLQSKHNILLAAQQRLTNGDLSVLLIENKRLQAEVSLLHENINLINQTYVKFPIFSPLKEKELSLKQELEKLICTSQTLKKDLNLIQDSNNSSKIITTYKKNSSTLKQIYCLLSKLKLIIASKLSSEPLNLSALLELDTAPTDFSLSSLSSQIHKKVSAIKILISDKLAESYSESCDLQ